MPKIQRIAHFEAFILFFLSENLEKQYKSFLTSDLGKIYKAIPWEEMIKAFEIKESKKGPTAERKEGQKKKEFQ